MKISDIINTNSFRTFFENANRYCTLLEESFEKNQNEFLIELRSVLSDLYSSAIRLPWIDLDSSEDYEEKIDSLSVMNSLEGIFNNSRYYDYVFNVTSGHKELVKGDLVDDLGDIYKDLKYALMIFNLDKPNSTEDALWQFKFDFEYHWEKHCINALGTIYSLLKDD